MALTETVELDSIEVLADCTLLVKETTTVLRDGLALARTERRWALMPGDSLDGQPERVVVLARSLWTDDVVRARLDSILRGDAASAEA